MYKCMYKNSIKILQDSLTLDLANLYIEMWIKSVWAYK